jgi:hypothetical protein
MIKKIKEKNKNLQPNLEAWPHPEVPPQKKHLSEVTGSRKSPRGLESNTC